MKNAKWICRYALSYKVTLILMLACMIFLLICDGYAFDYANGTANIPLKAGWNMISFPGTLADTSPDSLVKEGSQIILPMYRWDPESYSYVEVTEINPYEGYWILTMADETLTAEITLSFSFTISLKAGWNMVGSVRCV